MLMANYPGDVRMTDASVARRVGLPPGPSHPQNRAAHDGETLIPCVWNSDANSESSR